MEWYLGNKLERADWSKGPSQLVWGSSELVSIAFDFMGNKCIAIVKFEGSLSTGDIEYFQNIFMVTTGKESPITLAS